MLEPPDDPEDPWVKVAIAAAAREPVREPPRCPVCGIVVGVTDQDVVKVHFTKVTDTRPCRASFGPLVPPPPKLPKGSQSK